MVDITQDGQPAEDSRSVVVQKKKKPSSENMAMIQAIERVALNPAADVEKLKQMLDLQERIMDRNAKMAYDSAMAMMQPELPEVEKHAQGHNSKYAKFDQILKAIKPSLQKYGFSITHRVKVENGLIWITAVMSHKEGHREETTLPLPPDNTGNKNAVQAIASSTEYGRRYTMNSLLGIATKDADVDGGLGESPKKKVRAVSEPEQADKKSIDQQANRPAQPNGSVQEFVKPNQIKLLRTKMASAGKSEVDLLKRFEIKKIEELRFPADLNGAIEWISE